MQLPPVAVLVTWPQGNYTDPSEVRGPAILILTLIFVPLLVILVLLRTYTRLRLSGNFGADDIAIVAAVFPTMGCAVLTLLAVIHYGWSRHVWDVPPDQLILGLKYVIAVEVLFSIACSLTKLSMLLLILRVMAAGSIVLRRLSITVMVVVFLETLIFCIVVINTCSPVSDYWILSFQPQKCVNETAHLLAAGIINTLTDFCVVLIPIPVVMRLRLPMRQRMCCALLFGAGFIVCIAGSFRIAYTYQLNTTYDKTWLAYPTWISGTIELYLGIIATSIPAIKPFISRYFPRILSSNGSNQTSSSWILKSLEPRLDRNMPKSPVSDHSSINFIKSSFPAPLRFTSDVEKAFPLKWKSSPLPLTPVISSFSTYKKDPAEDEDEKTTSLGLPRAQLMDSHPPPPPPLPLYEAANSSKSSLSSFSTAWPDEQQPRSGGGLKAPRHAKREGLVLGKGVSAVKDAVDTNLREGMI